MYMKFLFHFITFCVLKSYCYFCPKAMYQVILRPRLSRDTRGRRRIIAFLFLYPRRDVHEVSVARYNLLCFEKLLLSLQRERCGFSHVGVLFFFPCFLFFSSSCLLLAYELARCIIHKWVVLCNIHWQGYDFFSGEARQTNEIIRTELEKIKRWPKPPLKVWKESLKLSRRIFDIHTLQR